MFEMWLAAQLINVVFVGLKALAVVVGAGLGVKLMLRASGVKL